MVKEQDAREQLKLVAEHPEGEGAGQEGRVHEEALAEGDFVGHGAGLVEKPIREW